MRVALLAAVLAMSCRLDLDSREVPTACDVRDDIAVCNEAESHSDYAWLEANIFTTNCSGDSCHNGPKNGKPAGGKIVLVGGAAYKTLLGDSGTGAESAVDPGYKLVVPGRPDQSYMYFLMRGIPAKQGLPPFNEPPEAVGYMPMDNNTLCCQKLDAVRRWIEAGAPP